MHDRHRIDAGATPPARLPVWGTALECYRFLLGHPRQVARVAWLPLAVLFALNMLFDTFRPTPEPTDPTVAMAEASSLLGATLASVLIQSAVAAMTLVVWHRLVMQGYEVGARTVPMRVGLSEIRYLLRWMLISLMFLGIMAGTVVGLVMLAFAVMVAMQAVSILAAGGGMRLGEQGELLTVIGEVSTPLAVLAAIYFTTRLSLVLPATATGKPTGFDHAWDVSRGNGLRMALASLIVMAPVQLVIFALLKLTGSMAGNLLYYPLGLLTSAALLMMILVTGTVLSLFSLGLDPGQTAAMSEPSESAA